MPAIVFVDTDLSAVTDRSGQTRIGREEIGAQLVAACVEQYAGWSVRYLRQDTVQIEQIVTAIKGGDCDALALFPYSYTKSLADQVAERFKGKVPIIYGGYHAGVGRMAKVVFDEGRADFVVRGRGERALPQLLDDISAGCTKRGVVQARELSGGCQSRYPLDELPWPLRFEEFMARFKKNELLFAPPETLIENPTKRVTIAGSFGCDGRCDYCSSWIMSPKTLHRSPTNIVDEMCSLDKRFGPGLVYVIANPLFNVDRGWVMELCQQMEKRGPFPAFCLPDFNLDREMVQAMKRAGIFMAMMGLEFADTAVRTERGKRPGDPELAYNLCDEVGILTRAYFMIGRLGMTYADVEAEKQALESLSFRADQLRVSFEVPFPGTVVANRLNPGDTIAGYDDYTTDKVVYKTGMSQEQWDRARQEITGEYYAAEKQKRHYADKIRRHPELEKSISGFLDRIQ